VATTQWIFNARCFAGTFRFVSIVRASFRMSRNEQFDTKAVAAFWGITQRTAQNWVKRSYPLDDVLAMARMLANLPRAPINAVQRAQEILTGRLSAESYTSTVVSADSNSARGTLSRGEREMLEEASEPMSLRAYRDRVGRLLASAVESRNTELVAYYEPRFFKAADALMKEEAHLKKMGLDNLEVVDKETLERLFGVFAWSVVRGVDQASCSIAKRGTNLTFEEEVYALVHPILMDARFAVPMMKMGTFAKQIGFPDFALRALESAFSGFVADPSSWREHVG
jgi:hypothetical protein